MRHYQSILSGKDVSGYVIHTLASALATIGWVQGVTSVDPLTLIQLLVRASAERRSFEAIALLSENLPSRQTLRIALASLLPATPEGLEPVVVEALQKRLPKSLSRRPRTMAIDMHNKPYYGDKDTPGTYRGQPKASTKTFFAYATLMVIRKGQTYTIGLIPIVNGQELPDIIDRLLSQAAQKGLRPKCLLLDRGFYAAKVMLHLQEKELSYLMPMIRRGKSGETIKECTGTAQFFVKGRRGWRKYSWEARIRVDGKKGKRIQVTSDVCMVPTEKKPGQKGKSRPWVFVSHGLRTMGLQDVAALYRKRFRIETGYRQMREGLAQTCSRNVVYRLLLILIAMVLRNLWVWLHWTRFAGRNEEGKRVLRLYLMRARRMLGCIVRYLDLKLGIPEGIPVPSPYIN